MIGESLSNFPLEISLIFSLYDFLAKCVTIAGRARRVRLRDDSLAIVQTFKNQRTKLSLRVSKAARVQTRFKKTHAKRRKVTTRKGAEG